ncbi:MAG: type II secretion system protein GspM [Lysobacterales bacterium]
MNVWWQNLSARDRRVVWIGAAILSLLLYWAALLDPAQSARHRLAGQVAAAETDLAFMQQAAQQLARLPGSGVSSPLDRAGRSLLAVADGSAREARLGNAIKRIEPVSASRATVWLEAADFDVVAAWLEQLESRYGIRVDEYSFQRAQATGTVDARIGLLDSPG